MDDAAQEETSTETVLFNPLKFQRAEAISIIVREAGRCGLQVDSIRERPKWFSVDVRVALTGSPEQIKAFYLKAGGRGEHEPPGTGLRRWLAGIWEGIEGSGW